MRNDHAVRVSTGAAGKGADMRKSDLTERIARLEREIALLPEGSITKKTIRGKEYFYRRIMQDGK